MARRLPRFLLLLLLGSACSTSSGTSGDPAGPAPSGDAGGGGGDAGVLPGDAEADARAADAATNDAAPVAIVCPTAPPFDETNQALVEKCTKPVFVAVGDYSRRAVSNDAVTWTTSSIKKADVPAGANVDLIAETTVTVHGGVIVIVGGNGIFSSHDGGATFVEAPNVNHPGFELYGPGVGFLNGSFWVVADGGTWTSTDGSKWTGWLGDTKLTGHSTTSADGSVVASFNGHGHGVVTGGGKVLFADDATRYRTFDGTSWFESQIGAYAGWISGVTYGNGQFVATGDTCCNYAPPTAGTLRAVSADGITWRTATNDTPGALQVAAFGGVVWDGKRFLATAGPWVPEAYSSADGTTWTKETISGAMGTMTIQSGVYSAISHTSVFRSTDGATWTETLKSTGEEADKWFAGIASGRVLK